MSSKDDGGGQTFILYAICNQPNLKLELQLTLSLLVSTAYPELGTAQPQLVCSFSPKIEWSL